MGISGKLEEKIKKSAKRLGISGESAELTICELQLIILRSKKQFTKIVYENRSQKQFTKIVYKNSHGQQTVLQKNKK